MWRALVVVLCGAVGGRVLDVRVHGDVLFGMQLSEAAQRHVARAQPPATATGGPRAHPQRLPACPHRYPTQGQVDALLSHMRNELTKVFVRANFFLKSEDNSRDVGVWRAEGEEAASSTSTPATSSAPSARVTTSVERNRYQIVDSKKTQFFEHIFHNMTEEFSEYNVSASVSRAQLDPCPQQDDVRRAWRDLLRRSMATFRRAALSCVQNYLKLQACEERAQARLVRYLVRELSGMRSRHLRLLCTRFQVCLDRDHVLPEPATGPSTSRTRDWR